MKNSAIGGIDFCNPNPPDRVAFQAFRASLRHARTTHVGEREAPNSLDPIVCVAAHTAVVFGLRMPLVAHRKWGRRHSVSDIGSWTRRRRRVDLSAEYHCLPGHSYCRRLCGSVSSHSDTPSRKRSWFRMHPDSVAQFAKPHVLNTAKLPSAWIRTTDLVCASFVATLRCSLRGRFGHSDITSGACVDFERME